MQVNITNATTNLTSTVKARTYNVWPKKGVGGEEYTLTVNGLDTKDVRATGGGKYPLYTYFKYDGKIWWLPKEVGMLPSGSKIDVITEAPAPAPAPEPTLADQAKQAIESQISKPPRRSNKK